MVRQRLDLCQSGDSKRSGQGGDDSLRGRQDDQVAALDRVAFLQAVVVPAVVLGAVLAPPADGIALDGLPGLPGALELSVRRRVLASEDGLVRVLLDRRDPDLDAVRREGHCRR